LSEEQRSIIPEEQAKEPEGIHTDVFECESPSCNGWMRKNYSFEESPDCPICHSSMIESVRHLQKPEKQINRKRIHFGKVLKH
jgi:hypothetical protein